MKTFIQKHFFEIFICLVSVSIVSAGISGCTKSANDTASQIGGQTDKEVKSLEMRSQWKTACEKTSILGDIFALPSQTTDLDFGASHSSTTKLYKDDNCQNPAITVVENGSYSLGDKVTTDTYALNMHYDSVTVNPLTDDGTNTLNNIHACGFNDWKTGQAKDVTAATTPTPIVSRCWTKTPRDVYELISINGNKIKLGSSKDGKDKSAPDKRPSEIDQARVFSK